MKIDKLIQLADQHQRNRAIAEGHRVFDSLWLGPVYAGNGSRPAQDRIWDIFLETDWNPIQMAKLLGVEPRDTWHTHRWVMDSKDLPLEVCNG